MCCHERTSAYLLCSPCYILCPLSFSVILEPLHPEGGTFLSISSLGLNDVMSPITGADLKKMENEKGIVARFVIGRR